MNLSRRIFVLGGTHTPFIGKFHPDFIWKGHAEFGKRENPSLEGHLAQATRDALETTSVPASAVDKAFVGNFAGELFCNQGHLGAALAGVDPGLALKPIMRVEGACASGGLAVACGLDAIGAGRDVVLVVGAEVQTTVSAKEGAKFLAAAAHFPTQRSIDPFTFPCLFARRVRHCREQRDIREDDLDRLVLKAYANANRNPLAHMHAVTMTAETVAASDSNPRFLTNPEFKDFLKVSDCSQVSDGASALVLVSEAGLEKLGRSQADAVELVGLGHATAPLEGDPSDPASLTTTAAAARSAYEAAGMGPDDMGVAEVHDCFSITELLMYEALGFAGAGEGVKLVRDGATELTGKIPVNTGGGLVAFGHPVGATGVKQLVEVARQIRGEAGGYQLETPPQAGICANMGGDDRTAVVTILRRCG